MEVFIEGNPGKGNREEQWADSGIYCLERWSEDTGKPERVRYESELRQSECERPVCVSRPWALCGLLQPSPSPSVTTSITGRGSAPALIPLRFTPTAIPALHQRLIGSPRPAHSTFIFHIYMYSKAFILHSRRTIYCNCNSGTGPLYSLSCTHPWFFQFHFFPFNSFFFLSCSKNTVSQFICVPSAPQCPINSMFNSLSASSYSESLGFASGTHTHG